MAEKIKFGKYVELAYEVFIVEGEREAQVYKFDKKHPDHFVFGLEQGMLEGFTQAISGLEAGDKFELTLTPDQAFGERDPQMIHEVDRSVFVVDGEFDEERVFVGAMIPMMTADGFRIDGLVEKVTDEKVTLDFNHQLAGETVGYRGEVLTVRDATPEELEPPKHHCGCGCDHDHCDHDHCDHDHCDHDNCDCDHDHKGGHCDCGCEK